MLNGLTAVKSSPALWTSALELLFLVAPCHSLSPNLGNSTARPTPTKCEITTPPPTGAALPKEVPRKICLYTSESHPIWFVQANLRCFIMAKTSSHRVWCSMAQLHRADTAARFTEHEPATTCLRWGSNLFQHKR